MEMPFEVYFLRSGSFIPKSIATESRKATSEQNPSPTPNMQWKHGGWLGLLLFNCRFVTFTKKSPHLSRLLSMNTIIKNKLLKNVQSQTEGFSESPNSCDA